MKSDNKNLNVILVVLCSLVVLTSLFGAFTLSKDNLTSEDVKNIVTEEINSLSIPTAEEIASLVSLPEITVENADNELLNNYLERAYSNESNEIKNESNISAFEELEDHNYRVIYNYLSSLFEGEIERNFEINFTKTEIKVTMLGLEEDEDKGALVTFEIEVEYEFEEGVRDTFEKDLVIVYSVNFDEGDFDDETVKLVSIN